MRPIDEIARTAFELLQHGDQDARLIGDVTVGEVLAVMTYAFGAYEKAERRRAGLAAECDEATAAVKRLREQREEARELVRRNAEHLPILQMAAVEWDAEEAAERGEGT